LKEQLNTKGQAVTAGLLAGLASTRGFLIEREIPDYLTLSGEQAVDVVSTSGADIGVAYVEEAARLGPLNAILDSPQRQTAQERCELLKGLELLEAQLLGWLVVQLGSDRVAESIEDEEQQALMDLFVKQREAWRGFLLEASEQNQIIKASEPLVAKLKECGFTRKISSPLIRSLLASFKSNSRSEDEHVDPILFWAQFLSEIRTKLLYGNTQLVCKWAARHRGRLDFRLSVIQGLQGLSRALDDFDGSRGYQLSTYATWWIRQAITRAAANHSTPIRIPVHLHEEMLKLGRAFSRHWSPGKPMMGALYLAGEELEFSPNKVATLANLGTRSVSGDRETRSGLGPTAERFFDVHALSTRSVMAGGTVELAHERFRAILEAVRERSSYSKTRQKGLKRQFEILFQRLGLGVPKPPTLEEVGQRAGLTRERIRQIESKAIKDLMACQEKELLDLLEGMRTETLCET